MTNHVASFVFMAFLWPWSPTALGADLNWNEAAAEQPVIHDYGTVIPGTVVSWEFTLTNNSSSTWKILGAKTSCSCVSNSMLPAKLEPGENVGFTLKFQAPNGAGAESVQGWILKEIDGRLTSSPLVLRYLVADYLNLPRSVPRLDGISPISLKVPRGGHPDQWTKVTVDAGPSVDRFIVSLNPQGNDWKLDIATRDGRHKGDFNGCLTFTYFNGETQLDRRQTLEVTARIPGSVIPSPSSVLIGGVFQGSVREAMVTLRPLSGHELPKVELIECLDPKRMKVTQLEREESRGEECRLLLRFSASGEPGKASSRIILHLDNGELFHIPYLAAVAKPEAGSAEFSPR